ncbi:MAG: M1 family aminopeptidase [Chitinophagales bacterium]
MGHQWFGDHVTCATWGHIWINEGFASYSEYIFQESVNYNIAQNDIEYNNVMSQPEVVFMCMTIITECHI